MGWKKFAKAVVIRAVRTLAQTAAAAIGTSAMLSEVNWMMVVGTSGLAAILSVLSSLATGLPEASKE